MSNIPNHLACGSLLQGGKYRIVRFIAAGGFGCTYEAEHVMLRKRMAIKEFFMQDYCNREADTCHVTVGTQSMLEMVNKYKRKFIDEARALSELHHDGIVSVSDVFEENGTAYFVMEYVSGHTLGDLCKTEPLPEKHALFYIRQVCEALTYVHDNGRLPVVNFAAGGVATPADAALMMQLGAEGVFVGSGIFKSGNPEKRAQAIVKAVTNYNNPKILAELSEDLGEAMVGINEDEIQLLMAERGK